MLMTNALTLPSLDDLLLALGATSTPDYVLSGFPEYATGPESLAADQRQTLRTVAAVITRSQASYVPVVAALITGHADKALRKPVGERSAFERDVSQRRATAAADRLLRELVAESSGAHFAKIFRHVAIGLGNGKPRHLNATSELQMQQNRRVEITLLTRRTNQARCGVI